MQHDDDRTIASGEGDRDASRPQGCLSPASSSERGMRRMSGHHSQGRIMMLCRFLGLLSLAVACANWAYLVPVGRDDGRTPLHFAAFDDSVWVAKFLVRVGADVTAKDNDGRTPLYFAAKRFDAGEAVVPEFVFSSQSGYRPQCELPLLSPRTTNVCGNVGEGVAIRGKR